MVYFIIFFLILFVALLLKKYGKDKLITLSEDKSIYHYFYPLSLFIYDKFFLKFDKNVTDTKKKLRSIGQNNYYEYIAVRGGKLILLLLAICIVAAFFDISYKKEALIGYLKRPKLGDEEAVYKLKASDGRDEYIIDAHITSERVSEKKIYDYMDMAYEELKERIKGNNDSLEKINSNLVLVDNCLDGLISVEWSSSDDELVDRYGHVYNMELENKSMVTLRATLKLSGYEAYYDIDITVFPYEYTEYELMKRDIEQAIEEANKTSDNEKVELPQRINGKEVIYTNPEKNYAFSFFIIGMVLLCVYIYMPDSSLKKQLDFRKKQLEFDYPEIVSKLAVLLGCGMTLNRAWEKIVLDYKKTNMKRYAYEEMYIAYNRMESGFSSLSEFEAFGDRCALREYKRLVSILTRNLKKGNEGLLEKLNYEVNDAFDNRKKLARILGEEASTKLLIPMIIMLVIVMGIVIIPVFISIG